VQEWIDAVNVLIKKGMTLAEVEKNFTFRDRYAPNRQGGDGVDSGKSKHHALYEVLKINKSRLFITEY